MDAINNKSITESALPQAKEKLDKLRYVLLNVGKPDFRVCLKCKSPIPVAQLIVKPESLYCVNYAR